jgi:hypothetical protein
MKFIKYYLHNYILTFNFSFNLFSFYSQIGWYQRVLLKHKADQP